MEAVVPFLESIFDLNRNLETHATAAASRERTRALAAARAPGLIAEYNAIGGSPLHAQARTQATLLETELKTRGIDAFTLLGMQFTSPSIEDAVAEATARGATRVVGLPVYPLCGPTTTVAALASLRAAVTGRAPHVDLWEIAGWHRHDAYVQMRGRVIRDSAAAAGFALDDPGTVLLFSAHGTPVKYIAEGSRYVEYVEDSCAGVARAAGVAEYEIGYQNHSNRPLEWTQPEVAAVIDRLAAQGVQSVVVDPISFMHEQSETLAELDHELREHATGLGLRFHRVPVAYDDADFITVLADLVQPFARATGDEDVAASARAALRPCICRPTACTFCLNGAR